MKCASLKRLETSKNMIQKHDTVDDFDHESGGIAHSIDYYNEPSICGGNLCSIIIVETCTSKYICIPLICVKLNILGAELCEE